MATEKNSRSLLNLWLVKSCNNAHSGRFEATSSMDLAVQAQRPNEGLEYSPEHGLCVGYLTCGVIRGSEAPDEPCISSQKLSIIGISRLSWIALTYLCLRRHSPEAGLVGITKGDVPWVGSTPRSHYRCRCIYLLCNSSQACPV